VNRGLFALGLQIAYLAVAFGARGLIHRRRTGDWGLRFQRHDRVARLCGALFTAAVLTGTIGLILAAMSVLDPWALLDHTAVAAVGLAVFAAGAWLTFAAQAAMGTSWRIGVDPAERTELVTHGPFRNVRNPIFTGMITAATGLTLLAPNTVTVIGLALLFVAVEIQVRSVEEPYLRAAMPPWAAYATHAGRFVPHIGRIAF
jgi:protein-S-isoprenylcysteine O-methyltransferase Ste14